MRKKILWHGDFCCNTGFNTVGENIIKRIMDKYDITVIASNYFGEPHDWNFKVYPAKKFNSDDPRYTDDMGRQRVLDELASGDYDILFTIRDPFNVAEGQFGRAIKKLQEYKKFKWVYYFALDIKPRKHWIDEAIALADYPVSFTKWAKNAVLEVKPNLKIDTIYHGTDLETFKPLSRQVKRDLKRKTFDDKFVVTNVNRNISRKDIPKTLMVFKKFHKEVPNSILYLHMRHQDLGGDFRLMAQEIGLVAGEDILWAEMDEDRMPSKERMNEIYNISDMIITTTGGEGWGLSITEAMACKVPVVAPNHTSLTEIVQGRGYLVESGTDENLWVNRGNEYFNLWCPQVNVKDMVDTMKYAYNHKEETQKLTENAYEWVKTLSWDSIVKEWEKLFDSI